jgi:hypothetical protein
MIPGKHAGNIGDRFTLSQADFRRRKVERIPAQVAHGHIKRNSRAQAGLLEDHGEDFTF